MKESSKDEVKNEIATSTEAGPILIRGRVKIEGLITHSAPCAIDGEYGWGDAQGQEEW